MRRGPAARAAIVFGCWLTLVRGLVGSQRIGQGRVPFGPTDDVVKTALQYLTGYAHGRSRLGEVTIPALWQLLDNPTDEMVTECRHESTRHFLDQTRLLRDALGQLVNGALERPQGHADEEDRRRRRHRPGAW